jgi:hypothetical protein
LVGRKSEGFGNESVDRKQPQSESKGERRIRSGVLAASENRRGKANMKIKPTRNSGGVALELGPDEPAIPATHEDSEKETLPLFKIRRILVPIDFSSCSKKALQYAIPFAQLFGARLCLLYVGQGYYWIPELAAVDLSTYQFRERADAAARLARFATKDSRYGCGGPPSEKRSTHVGD